MSHLSSGFRSVPCDDTCASADSGFSEILGYRSRTRTGPIRVGFWGTETPLLHPDPVCLQVFFFVCGWLRHFHERKKTEERKKRRRCCCWCLKFKIGLVPRKEEGLKMKAEAGPAADRHGVAALPAAARVKVLS
ncbi:hypothetical protein ACFX2I_017500 [Malus domestica]